MSTPRRGRTAHDVSLDAALETEVFYSGASYRISLDDGLKVIGSDGSSETVGQCAHSTSEGIRVQFTPGCETYFFARAERGNPFGHRDIAAAVIVAVLGGH